MHRESSDQHFLHVLRRRWRVVLLFSVAVLAVDLGWIVFGPRTYESVAKLYVGIGRENISLDPTATMGETLNLYATRESEINSVLQMLESQHIADQVIDRVGVDTVLGKRTPASQDGPVAASFVSRGLSLFSAGGWKLDPESDRSQAVRKLQERTAIWAPINSSVLGIRYEAADPKLAQEVVREWVDIFLKEHLRLTRTEGAYEFFAQEVAAAKAELDEALRRLREAKDAAGLTSVAGQQKVIEDRLSAIELQLARNALALQSSKAKTEDLRETLKTLSPTTVTQESQGTAHEAWDRMREKLYDLQIQQQNFQAKYTDAHPTMTVIEEQVREVQQILESQPQTRSGSVVGPNPTYQLLHQSLLSEEAQMTAHQAEREGLTLQRAAVLDDLKALNEAVVGIVGLERQVAICEAKYRTGVEKMEQARIQEALDRQRVSSVNVVQPATFVEKPVSPNKRLSLAAGLVIAALGGVCLAFAVEYLDSGAVRMSPAALAERSQAAPAATSVSTSPQGA